MIMSPMNARVCTTFQDVRIKYSQFFFFQNLGSFGSSKFSSKNQDKKNQLFLHFPLGMVAFSGGSFRSKSDFS